ncbi:ComEC/Rec2 family competence protein [Halalkalibacter krulwichiae]|uniref:ComEC family competence protein n=1 Tax=Halalkalibacter krulwichiae TaxID=199441 RepID=A0A1Y9THF4_9BACI|nr:MBL fold metallo-hydrolase [Halalkalibacter krulwichiae]ARK28635.1 ComEC family competence protein [Halalkalibacter krulwichiae]
MRPLRKAEIFNQDLHQGKLQIRYFNLESDKKSGDSILIVSPDGKSMLIDAGIVATGHKLNKYLNDLSIDRIDVAVATHPHHDHIGGYETILKTKQIGTLLMPELPHTTSAYARFLNTIQKRNVTPTYVVAGNHFSLGKEVSVEVLSPSHEALEKARKEKKLSTRYINNLSLVLKVTYRDQTFLFTGDIYKKQEEKLVNFKGEKLHVDLLDAPHHGKRTSSSNLFIQTVQPSYTVISMNNLRSKRAYSRYEKTGSRVVSTGINGNILIVSDGQSLTIKTER